MNAIQNQQNKDEISLKELIVKTREWGSFIFNKWKILVTVMVIAGLAGFFYVRSKTALYKAECTFVLDEGGGGSASAIGGLAFLGMNVNNGSASLFNNTKNIIWFYKSKLMLHQTLMTEVVFDGKKRLLIDIFLHESGLDKVYNKELVQRKLHFKSGIRPDSLSKEENSVVLSCIGLLKGKDYLDISETSEANNLITVTFKSKNEEFSKAFTEALVDNVNQYYILTKTEKTSEEIKLLQQKADSAQMMLNSNMYQAASSVEAVPYANPNRATLLVAPERKRIDVQATSAMYIELTKNLQARRMALAQETPLIKIIEGPSLPLDVVKPSAVKGAIIWAIIAAFLVTIYLIAKRVYKRALQ